MRKIFLVMVLLFGMLAFPVAAADTVVVPNQAIGLEAPVTVEPASIDVAIREIIVVAVVATVAFAVISWISSVLVAKTPSKTTEPEVSVEIFSGFV